jgi:hypothetical protein
MSQSEVAAARQQEMMAQQARFDAISSGLGGMTGMLTAGIEAGAFKK